MNFMRKSVDSLKYFAILAVFLLMPAAAHADFAGIYAPVNWTQSIGGAGSVNTGGAPASIVLNSQIGQTNYTILLVSGGFWSFDYEYSSPYVGGADTAGYLINGSFTQLADNNGGSGASGSIAVLAGQTIGFRVNGNGELNSALTISNFSGPSAVPEPSSLALMAAGAAGLVAARRRRKAS
jgi:hypothetical protein